VNTRYNRDSSSDSREATSENREMSSGTLDRSNSNRDQDEDESVSISETIKSDQRSVSRYSTDYSRCPENYRGDIPLVLSTSQATIIEEATMAAVRALMADMDKSAVTKIEFEKLLSDIVHPIENRLQVRTKHTHNTHTERKHTHNSVTHHTKTNIL
jgi:hypothetical protein